MSKFTPGPWHVAAYNDALYITSGRPPASSNDHPLNDSDRTVIARMLIPDCGSLEANAALIADAPALLKALKDLFDSEWQDDDGDERLEDARDKARALIAKHGGGI